ncbi:DNA photolyase family protein [Hoyosella sp. YIM 151337]|uniref:cryptochrome/photolyase family protein n=1 Tax=Hoyosella sp. YIM 151337 TaxID=2992742 RepID=UPI002235C22F|nr:deoxyribodipyrimidine photo-lyase [Hoyosella sp. YIM 151337]MCW4355999.1 DNA photolyase family protein [Hoyosella sp. YIM 151337]
MRIAATRSEKVAENTIVWFRRDLRTRDMPTFLAAAAAAEQALGVFVLDPALLGPAGAHRVAALHACLRDLDRQLGGKLLVVEGEPIRVIPGLAEAIGASQVHVSADFGPYGAARDEQIAEKIDLVRTGSPFAVSPGRVVKQDGSPYRVFTPFYRSWLDHGWRKPAKTDASTVAWLDPEDVRQFRRAELPDEEPVCAVGEDAAQRQWRKFLKADGGGVNEYHANRDRPDLDDTSRMSVHLKFGTIHPRTMLADLATIDSDGAREYRRQLAWRDFYGDVLHHNPDSARRNLDRKFDAMPLDSGDEAWRCFRAWCDGETGYPIVDAGMRQLRAEGWMHNRVRMIVASFLVKDLHLPWWWGARHFMRYLVDGDLPANQHGWQWVAGSGTDASPFFRIFNPVTQGKKFDPDGEYVRRWVPELRNIDGAKVHTVGERGEDVTGYPAPIVDHAEERKEALARYDEVKAASAN